MAEYSKIEWCDHTFNPWMGCVKVSQGCKNCYAERLIDKRLKKAKWGPNSVRVRTSASYWKQPLAWNADTWLTCPECGWRGSSIDATRNNFGEHRCPACDCGNPMHPTRQRVFCASLADVFEDRPELPAWRDDLYTLIDQTPNLDWLILTKRPENIFKMLPVRWSKLGWGKDAPVPRNIWMGVSTEDQENFIIRWSILVATSRLLHFEKLFVSAEPLLGPIDMSPSMRFGTRTPVGFVDRGIDWVIAGGESGPGARPMHPDWVRSLRDQCLASGSPFLFKQWGEWAPEYPQGVSLANRSMTYFENHTFYRVGKHLSGRLLDGREHNDFPA